MFDLDLGHIVGPKFSPFLIWGGSNLPWLCGRIVTTISRGKVKMYTQRLPLVNGML